MHGFPSDATGTAEAIRTGELSAREAVETAIARIEHHNPTVNAVVAQRFEEALADVGTGLPDGPLHGVPMLIKDLGMRVAGLPTTRGSSLWATDVATADHELVARYQRAGMVVLGMSNTPQLGQNGSTEPVLHGPTRNPWRTTHSAGGSSGGSAAAVASGMVPAAHGSDGGGSIRIPSSMCGLVGLKPSRGRVTTFPDPSTLATPLTTHHALTRSVRDSALLLDVTAQPLPGSPITPPGGSGTFTEQMCANPGRLRIGLVTRRRDGGVISEDVAATTRRAATLCEQLGHHVEETELDYDPAVSGLAFGRLMGVDLMHQVDQRLNQLGRELREGDLEPFVQVMLERYRELTTTDLYEAYQALETTAWRLGRMFDKYDLLLTPTVARPVPEIGVLDTTRPEVIYEIGADYAALTSLWNVTGQPAISVPCEHNSEGLPVGVQFIANFGQEGRLLSLAAHVEQAAPWPLMPPDGAD